MENVYWWLYLLGFGIIAVQILILYWTGKAVPPKEILNKYTKVEVFKAKLPFTESWKRYINTEDQLVFYKYRERLFLAQAAIILTIVLLILFIHFWLAYRSI